MNWEPYLHSVFGEISRRLKIKSQVASGEKVKLVFFMETSRLLKVRLVGHSESLALVRVKPVSLELEAVFEGLELGRVYENQSSQRLSLEEKLSLILRIFEDGNESYGHYKS